MSRRNLQNCFIVKHGCIFYYWIVFIIFYALFWDFGFFFFFFRLLIKFIFIFVTFTRVDVLWIETRWLCICIIYIIIRSYRASWRQWFPPDRLSKIKFNNLACSFVFIYWDECMCFALTLASAGGLRKWIIIL